MSNARNILLACMVLVSSSLSLAQNKLNARLFYSKPKLYNSPSQAAGIDLSGYVLTVSLPEDNRSQFYGAVIYKNKKVRPLEDFFETSAMVEIQNKIKADLKKLSPQKKHRAPLKNLTIHSSVEIFYPQVRGFIHSESFAKVRMQLEALVSNVVFIHKKYEILYVTHGADKEFEGDISMTVEDGENVTIGMALRKTLDQFYADLHKALALPANQIILSGTVVSSKTGTGLAAPIVFQSDSTAVTVSDTNGRFEKIITRAKQFVRISAVNYLNYVSLFDPTTTDLKIVEATFKLQPIEKGVSVKLRNILFQVSTTQLLPESYPELDSVYIFLKTNPQVQIELQGHTDNRGNADRDVELSQQRVDKIKNYLVVKGINSKRIKGVGFGGTKPIATNDTEEGRKQNRRVEFVVVKN